MEQTLHNAFCDDIAYLIYYHFEAMTIQSHIRRWFYKHVARKEWKYLRSLVTTHLSTHQFSLLQQNANVRREWRTEPQSWIYMINHETSTLHLILKEINIGYWK